MDYLTSIGGWVVVVGSVGLMHVAVMFVCWFVSTVLLDFLVVVVFLVVCIDWLRHMWP